MVTKTALTNSHFTDLHFQNMKNKQKSDIYSVSLLVVSNQDKS